MSEQSTTVNIPQDGMIEDIHNINKSSTQYNYALNAINSEFTGENFVLQNEHSNILEINFPKGFIVIGKQEIPEQERVIYALVNPETGDSEIGETLRKSYQDLTDEFFQNCFSCSKEQYLEKKPLEELVQKPFSAYFTIESAKCLNFNKNFPVDFEYKITDCGLNLYFTDNLNQRRFIYFDYVDNNSNNYLLTKQEFKVVTGFQNDDCSLPIYSNELDCNKISYHPCYTKPEITFVDTNSTGNLKAGVYQIILSYATEDGQPLTEYFNASNPIPLRTKNITVPTDYNTGLGFSFIASKLDGSVYQYFNVVIAETVDNFTEFKLLGTYPINSINYTFNINYTGNEEVIKLEASDIFAKYPFYIKAKSVTTANRYLFFGSPTELKLPNLQTIADRIKLFWATAAVNENIYSEALGTNKFKSFMRDEVYPLSLIIEFCNGAETYPIHIPNREATPYDLEVINNSDVIDDFNCGDVERLNKRWQLYNTATILQSPYEFTENCDTPKLWEYGDFAYWESTDKYPNDPTTWGDLCGKPIRFHKFPDSLITHIHNKNNTFISSHPINFKENNIIYPIGIKVDEQSINTFLLEAKTQGLITQEDYDSVSGYRVVRGNRAGNKSIVAKGLLYDSWNYTKNGNVFNYPNYPYNDLRADYFLAPDSSIYDGSTVTPPKPSYFHNTQRYTFHSPDTHFTNPSLGSILKLETNEYGSFEGQYAYAENQAKYKLMSGFTRIISLGYGIASTAGDTLKNILKGLLFAGLGGVLNAVIVGAITTLNEAETFATIIKNFTPYINFAIQYNSVGKYNNYQNIDNNGNKIRPIIRGAYLQPFVQSIDEVIDPNTNQFSTILFNNLNRESSVYIKYTGSLLPNPSVLDNSRFTLSSLGFRRGKDSIENKYYGQISSYYASIKNYIPNQYGKIANVEYLETDSISKSLTLNNSPLIFGGDTFITRFALKRKHPFFLQTRYNFNNDSDVKYSELANAAFPNFYFNSEETIGERLESAGELKGLKGFLTGAVLGLSPSRFDGKSPKLFYQNGFIHLYSYGIPYFLVESDVNTDYRHGENNLEKAYYPAQSDVNFWLQEKNVPITEDNYYFYNKTYSKQNKESFIPRVIEKYDIESCKTELFNRVIYSSVDNNLNLTTALDGWRIFKANDFYDFPFSDGKLNTVDGIENDKILVRLENVSRIFNAYDTLQATDTNIQVSTGGIFQSRPKEFAKTDLGYIGSQHRAILHTEFGHIYVDAKRGQIFNLGLNGGGMEEISVKGIRNWFEQNLPFQLKKDFPTLPEDVLDNSYAGAGISLGFDKRFSRLLITKKDYKVLDKTILFDNEVKSFYITENNAKKFVNLNNSKYFCNKSWTLSYSFLTKSWISYHSYKPDYYINKVNYFSSGLNGTQSSLWGHNLTNKSYQVFYGKLEPFVIDYTSEKSITNNFVSSITFGLEVLRFHNEYDFFSNQNVTFNKGYVYNKSQNSGLLEFIPNNEENLSYVAQYPNALGDRTQVEITNAQGQWSFNDFSDIVKSTTNNVPIWLNTCGNDSKILNYQAVNYKKSDWDRGVITSLQNNVRLINDKHSNYKMIFLFSILNQNKSIR